MRYAIGLWAAGVGDARTLAELAQLAEDSGWDGFFLEDYITHWYGKETYDPWVALAAMAMSTKYIRLGTTVTPLPRRRPWKLAREAVTLDHLSNGRLILGVGLGGTKDPLNFDRLGEVTDMKQRAEMTDEALDILVGLWSGEPFSYTGQHYQVNEVTFLPKPVQQPHIPIWVGAGGLGSRSGAQCVLKVSSHIKIPIHLGSGKISSRRRYAPSKLTSKNTGQYPPRSTWLLEAACASQIGTRIALISASWQKLAQPGGMSS